MRENCERVVRLCGDSWSLVQFACLMACLTECLMQREQLYAAVVCHTSVPVCPCEGNTHPVHLHDDV